MTPYLKMYEYATQIMLFSSPKAFEYTTFLKSFKDKISLTHSNPKRTQLLKFTGHITYHNDFYFVPKTLFLNQNCFSQFNLNLRKPLENFLKQVEPHLWLVYVSLKWKNLIVEGSFSCWWSLLAGMTLCWQRRQVHFKCCK